MTDTLSAARAWLAAADPDASRAQLWLTQTSIVLLPLGRVFDAVRVDGPIAQPAIAAGIRGPVIADPRGDAVYFLVPPGGWGAWPVALRGIEYLGVATYLTVPSPSITAPPGVHWVQPPDGTGDLVDPEELTRALVGAV
jgi:hypothetical protein